MSNLLLRLMPQERRGSKPRCHFLTHGSSEQAADNLTQLISPFGSVSPADRWMPEGFDDVEEAQFHKTPGLIDTRIAKQLREWWLVADNSNAKTPNIDIASTCTIENRPGLLLVEAKAHDEELKKEMAGKILKQCASKESKANHERIRAAIVTARDGLYAATSLQWRISRDSHYQMSNRFAWSWKLTELGFPVALIYLGFLKADEMKDKGKPFADHNQWESLIKSHSKALFSPEIWNRRWAFNGQPFIPLIRSIEQRLDLLP